jgi:hypothetical protein
MPAPRYGRTHALARRRSEGPALGRQGYGGKGGAIRYVIPLSDMVHEHFALKL